MKLQIAVNNIVSGLTGAVVSIRDIFRYEGNLNLIDFTSDDDIPNLRAVKALTTPSALVFASISTGQPSIYNVLPGDIAALNVLARYPNFVALIGGTPFPDIQPTYSGAPGAFSAISVTLHNDGSGNTPEDVDIQFS